MRALLFMCGYAGVLVALAILLTGSIHSPVQDSKAGFMVQDTLVPVKIQLEQTSFTDMNVLFIKDTAGTIDAIANILGRGYGELMQFAVQNKLRPLKFMAWYYAPQPPWPVDIAIETDNLPAQLAGRIQSRVQQGGKVLIAHMWGPNNEVGQAYEKIENWLRENKRNPKGSPFDVYINDPNAVKDPSEIQTDVYQPIE